jgi:hypothetical protein
MKTKTTQENPESASLRCGGLVRAVRISDDLLRTRNTIKQLLGSKWEERVAEYRPYIEARMTRMKTDNVIECVLPLAKSMSDAGDSPLVLLAIACEMTSPSGPNKIDQQ